MRTVAIVACFLLHGASACSGGGSDRASAPDASIDLPDPMIPDSDEPASSTTVLIPAGIYDVEEIVTRAGTPDDWIRYQPELPGTVTFRGGGRVAVGYVIVDGIRVDGTLDPRLDDADPKSGGISIAADHVRIENSAIAGVNSVHNGYDTTGEPNCKEFDFGIRGVGVGVADAALDVTLFNTIVHGFREAASVHGGLVIDNSLFRNSFNGISLNESGMHLVIRASVFWDHPNHQFSIKTLRQGSVFWLENTILANSQDGIKAGGNWEGVDNLYVIHNTFWAPPYDPCGKYSGINHDNVRNQLVLRDNIFHWRNHPNAGNDAIVAIWDDTNHNLTVKRESDLVTGEQLIDVPSFEFSPSYAAPPLPSPGSPANGWGWVIPESVSEARSWLRLVPTSSGKAAGSDGLDVGTTHN